jgi:hypothetical protein
MNGGVFYWGKKAYSEKEWAFLFFIRIKRDIKEGGNEILLTPLRYSYLSYFRIQSLGLEKKVPRKGAQIFITSRG